MLSRDNENKSSLPSYMNNIHDRGSFYRITEKSLKMNKFYDGKMANASSSFIPKKSFNKIVNINMISSHILKKKYMMNLLMKRKKN